MPGKNEKVRSHHRGKANSKKTKNLIFIFPLTILALLIAIPTVPINVAGHDIYSHLGLDLVGGVQVLLEADVPADIDVTAKSMETARTIISNRAN
jgi:preprotein translocase subunit SecD